MNNHATLVSALIALGMLSLMLALFFFGGSRTHRPAAWKYTAQMDEATKLLNARQFQAAEAILLPLCRLSDAPASAFHLLALCAERQGNLAEAGRRWKRQQKYFPNETSGYVGGAQLLIRQNRRPEAEALLAWAARKVIHPAGLTKVLAELADADGDHENAVRLWAQARSEAPGLAEAYVKGHDALLAAGRPEEAAELLADAAMRLPSDHLVRAAVEKAAKG